MSNLPESSNFDAGVYQLELTDPVIGGPSGISNAPLKNLANRTKYLKDHVDALELLRAPLADPIFTGNPKAPTPSQGDSDTSIATTEFVKVLFDSAKGPAFSAIATASQSVSSATVTKVAINQRIFDTHNCFDVGNFRFTPNVPGYYQVDGVVRINVNGGTQVISWIFKNGSSYARGADLTGPTGFIASAQLPVSEVIYMNGTTDYLELYGYVTGTSGMLIVYADTGATSRFSASLLRRS